jgi:hypothetical protein
MLCNRSPGNCLLFCETNIIGLISTMPNTMSRFHNLVGLHQSTYNHEGLRIAKRFSPPESRDDMFEIIIHQLL